MLDMRYLVFLASIIIAFCTTSHAQGTKSPVQYRAITVITQPKAAVWIDGVGWGKANSDGRLEIKTVSPGIHTIRVRADGFKEKMQPLTVPQKGEVAVTLVKTTDEAELAFQEGERMAFSDREKSVEAYRRAISLRPKYPEAFVALARVLTEMQDTDEALKAIVSRPQTPARLCRGVSGRGPYSQRKRRRGRGRHRVQTSNHRGQRVSA